MSPRAVAQNGEARFLANPALGRAAAALAIYEGGTQLAQRARSLWRDRYAYTVTISERDPIYADVHDWLLTVLPDDRHRALQVRTGRGDDRATIDSPAPSGEQSAQSRLQLIFNDSRARRVTIDGHRLTVRHEVPETTSERSPQPAKIEFTATNHDAQQAIVTHLRRIHDENRADRKPLLRMVNSWGGWSARNDLPPRSLASVALPAGQRQRIVDDLAAFLAAEDRYNRLAIPWHRGYLLHGPPGTGKTSLVRALASEFRLDLWYVSLADLSADSSLINLLGEVGPRSMLLLEDIDTVALTHDRATADAGETGKVSLGSLLNALDGVATPHGLITVMTTNHYDKLDPALTRPGRMDLVEELGNTDEQTVRDLYAHFHGRPLGELPCPWPTDAIAAAEVSEVLKRHLNDADGARDALHHLAWLMVER